MSERRLLISFAHPDDESFGLGGLIARYVAEGVKVYLICATNGDAGTVSPEVMDGHRSVAALRLAELDCATEKLGLTEVFKFGYKDSGMVSAEANNDPECLWYAWQHKPEEVTRRVVEVIREVRPQVVITFNKYGGYGHPDHIAIQRATVEAFDLAGDSDYIIDGHEPYPPQKLYYGNIPVFLLRIGIWIMRLKGEDPRRIGRNKDINMMAILDNIEPNHARVDVGDYLDAWEAASACHVSQGGGRGGWTPRWLRRLLGVKQGFTRVYPPPVRNRIDEYDLFAGVVPDEVMKETI
jgi:LmbE family N-acetylglucosaminyl deacetylase